jgi:hypothetical protein
MPYNNRLFIIIKYFILLKIKMETAVYKTVEAGIS